MHAGLPHTPRQAARHHAQCSNACTLTADRAAGATRRRATRPVQAGWHHSCRVQPSASCLTKRSPCLQPDWWERYQLLEKEARSKPPAPATQAPMPAPAQPSSTQQPQGVVAAITQAGAAADSLRAQLTRLCTAPWLLCLSDALHAPSSRGRSRPSFCRHGQQPIDCVRFKHGPSSLVSAQAPCLPQLAGSQAGACAAP